jgi:hypothetical protein
MLQRGGHIRNLEQQPKFTFTDSDGRQIKQLNGQPMRYTADFRYDEAGNDGEWHDVVEDFKSLATMTEAATLRLALFKHYHPGKLKIVGRGIAARGTGDGETGGAMSSRRNPARPANNVVTEMVVELRASTGRGLTDIGLIDQQGRVWISGTVDLAMLAHVTEYALRREFAAALAQAAK